jgi:hypothetical protein
METFCNCDRLGEDLELCLHLPEQVNHRLVHGFLLSGLRRVDCSLKLVLVAELHLPELLLLTGQNGRERQGFATHGEGLVTVGPLGQSG